jgi:hypothetical protein
LSLSKNHKTLANSKAPIDKTPPDAGLLVTRPNYCKQKEEEEEDSSRVSPVKV